MKKDASDLHLSGMAEGMSFCKLTLHCSSLADHNIWCSHMIQLKPFENCPKCNFKLAKKGWMMLQRFDDAEVFLQRRRCNVSCTNGVVKVAL